MAHQLALSPFPAPTFMEQLGLALLYYLAAGLVAFAAYRIGTLSPSGFAAATLVGGTILTFGGLNRAALLIVFFASSSAFSYFKRSDERKKRASEMFDKGGRRDAAQVLANGGVAAALVLFSKPGNSDWASIFLSAYCAALAAATADTWSTELGILSKQNPRLITTLGIVPAGTSGGITVLGTLGAAGGALLIALSAIALGAFPFDRSWTPTAIDTLALIASTFFGGLAGALADSFLGATLQAGYRCPQCDKATESSVHKCGTRAVLVRGLPAVSNDLVNAGATAIGALVGGAVWWVLYT